MFLLFFLRLILQRSDHSARYSNLAAALSQAKASSSVQRTFTTSTWRVNETLHVKTFSPTGICTLWWLSWIVLSLAWMPEPRTQQSSLAFEGEGLGFRDLNTMRAPGCVFWF